MKVKNILRLIMLIVIISSIMFGNNVVNAAGYSISATSYDVKVGESVTINVNFTAATWDIVVSGKGITEGVYAGYTDDLSEKTTSKSISLNTSAEGTYTITMTGSITDENGQTTKINKSINVKVSKTVETTPEPPKTPETPTTNSNTGTNDSTTTTPVTKSSEARLKNFGITPNDFSGFKKDKTEYSTTVPNSVTEVNVYAQTAHENAKVEGTGKVSLKEGDNTVKVKVTAEDGKTTKTYTLTIKRKTVEEENAENGEARLKNLGIKPDEYDFTGFNSEKTEYTVEVPFEVEEIEVYATPMNSKAQITGTGIIELDVGENELLVEVIAANGEKKAYTLKVTRKESEETVGTIQEFGLESLTIKGLELTPNFKVGTYEYTVNLTEDIDSLEIQANSNDEDATVEIFGNESLQLGENVITIQVTNQETEKIATYQIIVNKNNVITEEIIQTSWLRPSTWGKEEKIKIAIIIVLIILIICAIILKIKISKESKNARKVDLPGAEELDKAIAEHQELSEEENREGINYVQDVENSEIQQNYIEDIAKDRFAVEDFEETPKRKGRHF